MEWYIVLAIILLIILGIILGIIVACMLSGERCSVSIQQRQPNHELTRIQQEQERKRQKKFSSKIKRKLNLSSKTEQPLAPVEDVRTYELTLKMGDKQTNPEELKSNTEAEVVLLPKLRGVTQAELDGRQKKREEIRKKYNL